MPAGMGDMAAMMRPPAVEPVFPELLRTPAPLSAAQRGALLERLARNRAVAEREFAAARDALSVAQSSDDVSQAHAAARAVALAASALAAQLQVESALAAGEAPQQVALAWLRGEMGLPTAPPAALHRTWAFHWAVLALLALFGASFLWIAWDRRRRVARLLDSAKSVLRPEAAPAQLSAPSAPSTSNNSSPSAGPVAARGATPDGMETTVPVLAPAPAGAPTAAGWRGTLRVAAIFGETPEVKTFRLVAPTGGRVPFDFSPGQFLNLHVMLDGAVVKRSYTIASSPSQRDFIELTVKREASGRVSPFLHDRVTVGQTIEASGPGGLFTFDGSAARSIVLIGGGVGITPLMSVLRYLTDHAWPGRIVLLYACRTTDDFIFRDELEYLQRRHDNLQVVATMTRGRGQTWMGQEGYPTAARIRDAVPDIAAQRVHVCGPPAMMDAVLAMLNDLGVPRSQIHVEKFGPDKRPAATVADQGAATSAAPVMARFARSGRLAAMTPGMSVLDAAESVGVSIDNACRSGTCGSCKVALLSGTVSQAVEDALTNADKAAGIILACQAQATSDVVIDA